MLLSVYENFFFCPKAPEMAWLCSPPKLLEALCKSMALAHSQSPALEDLHIVKRSLSPKFEVLLVILLCKLRGKILERIN